MNKNTVDVSFYSTKQLRFLLMIPRGVSDELRWHAAEELTKRQESANGTVMHRAYAPPDFDRNGNLKAR